MASYFYYVCNYHIIYVSIILYYSNLIFMYQAYTSNKIFIEKIILGGKKDMKSVLKMIFFFFKKFPLC